MNMSEPTRHRFRNNQKAVHLGNQAWDAAHSKGLIDIRVDYDRADRLRRLDGHRFVNLCSCSYLGLANHPQLLAGAVDAIQSQGAVDLPISRIRLRLNLLEEFEGQLTQLMRVRTVSAISCSAASAGILPLIASGHLSDDGQPRVMVFDQFAHFSMSLIKPICADESEVLTCPHNDMNYLEDVCQKHGRVAYVCDGVYSLGGHAPIEQLLELQDRYGLFLFIDDSHSLSLWGDRGQGYARSLMDEVSPDTVIVASLGKGFGSGGGIIMLGPAAKEDVVTRFGGPLAWSQGLSVPLIGAGIASIAFHRSPELRQLQQALQQRIAIFDEMVETEQRANGFPLKVVHVGDEARSVEASAQLLERGFYTSAVFFPIVRRGHAGLRVMIRADNRPEDLRAFGLALQETLGLTAPTGPLPTGPVPWMDNRSRAD